MTRRRVRSFFSLFLILCILLQTSPAAYAQSHASSQYEILGSIGGPTNAAAVNGSYVYVGKGTSVIILENSGGKLLQKGKQLNLPAFITDLKVEGGILYAADGAEGLYLLDISNPLEPNEKGVYKTKGYAESVAVKGTTAYLANGMEGLQIVNVSDPAKPTALGQVYKGKYAFGVAVSGNNAYVAASNDGLLIADISQGSAPKELSTYDTPGVARNVAVSGRLAYVADDWKGIVVIDISSPSKPVAVNTINTAGRAHGLSLDNNRLFVADAYMGLRVFDISDISAPKDLTSFIPAGSQLIRVVAVGGAAYCADQTNGILCFDTGNPASLKLTGFYSHTIPIPLQLPSDIMNYDYKESIARLLVLGVVSGRPDGMKPWDNLSRAELATILCNVMKVQKAGNTSKQTFKDVPKTHWAFGYIEKAAQLGLVGGKGGGRYDPEGVVTNAEAVAVMLRLVGRTAISGSWPSNVMNACDKLGLSIYVEGNAGDIIRRGNIFALIDKTVMEIPDARTRQTLLQSKFGVELQNFPLNCVQTAVKDGYAYVTCGESGLSVVDVSDPENCRQVAHINFPESVGHIRIYKNYVYLPAMNHLYVLNIADPLHPYCIDSLKMVPAPCPPRGVDIDSDTMYIADEWGFKIISMSAPADPVLIKHQRLMGEPTYGEYNQSSDIAVRKGIAYVSMEFAGTMLFDVTDANVPKYLGKYTDKDYGVFACNILFKDNLGFCVNGNVVDILDISDIRNPKSIGTLDNITSSQFYYEIGVYKNLLCFPAGAVGVAVFDASSPSNIRQTGTVETIGTATNVTVEGGFAYVADSIGGLSVIALDNASSIPRGGSSSAAPVSVKAADFNSKIFAGGPVEKCVLSADKTLAILNSERSVFSETLTVSNTDDSGQGSLRWCLETIKEGGRILFDPNVFSTSEPGTIYSSGPLQFSSDNVTLDASNAGVIIDGGTAGAGAWGLFVNTDKNIIKGLKFQNFDGETVQINGCNNIFGGSRLKGTGLNGEGNVIIHSGGIWINGSDNIVAGNNVGVDSDGATPAGNTCGLNLRGLNATRNVIGVDVPGYGNLVSNNTERGITLMGGPYCNLIEGNLVGTDITGTKAMGNYNNGIAIELCGFGNIIRNNISCANARYGILIYDSGSSFNVVVGNSSGIGADGKTLMPNMTEAMMIGGGGGASFYNIFGDSEPNLRNILCDVQGNIVSVIPDVGVYETIINGKVYKSADKDAY